MGKIGSCICRTSCSRVYVASNCLCAMAKSAFIVTVAADASAIENHAAGRVLVAECLGDDLMESVFKAGSVLPR